MHKKGELTNNENVSDLNANLYQVLSCNNSTPCK